MWGDSILSDCPRPNGWPSRCILPPRPPNLLVGFFGIGPSPVPGGTGCFFVFFPTAKGRPGSQRPPPTSLQALPTAPKNRQATRRPARSRFAPVPECGFVIAGCKPRVPARGPPPPPFAPPDPPCPATIFAPPPCNRQRLGSRGLPLPGRRQRGGSPRRAQPKGPRSFV